MGGLGDSEQAEPEVARLELSGAGGRHQRHRSPPGVEDRARGDRPVNGERDEPGALGERSRGERAAVPAAGVGGRARDLDVDGAGVQADREGLAEHWRRHRSRLRPDRLERARAAVAEHRERERLRVARRGDRGVEGVDRDRPGGRAEVDRRLGRGGAQPLGEHVQAVALRCASRTPTAGRSRRRRATPHRGRPARRRPSPLWASPPATAAPSRSSGSRPGRRRRTGRRGRRSACGSTSARARAFPSSSSPSPGG